MYGDREKEGIKVTMDTMKSRRWQKRTGEIAYQYCKDWPETPTKTLAKLIFKEHPTVFRSLEHTRGRIRYYRGQAGEVLRQKLGDKTMITQGTYNPFKLPPSDYVPRIPVQIEGKKILVLYDSHMPYHDLVALDLAIRTGKDAGCDTVFLGGDTIDCHEISHWIRDPEARDFAGELELTQSFLGYIKNEFPNARLYYKEGNHEERYWKYMRVKAPEVLKIRPVAELGIERLTMPYLLGLEPLGYTWVNGRTKANIGKLSVFHGHEFGKTLFSPVNPARGLYLKAKASAIVGEHHQSSEHTEKNVNDKIITTWSIGCLCGLSPEFSPYNKWNHGFAIIETDESSYHVKNFRIHEGKIL
jgi:hypothetical protein